MLIAILVTNTDESEFASHHPSDGEKFRDLIATQRSDWVFEAYWVKDNAFPEDMSAFDGVIITGSPASVHDGTPWIAKLEELIRNLVAQSVPVFGACFGHQVIATALGGKVEANSQGWVLGCVETELLDPKGHQKLNLYAAHKEQVTQLPKNAIISARTTGCPIAGFKIGETVLTTQYHPEMTPHFIEALLEEMGKGLETEILIAAKSSLSTIADREAMTGVIVSFFECATNKKAV